MIAAERPRFRVGRAAFWSATWGVGVAIGVAIAGWVTATSGSGAPGAAALVPMQDFVVTPLASGAVVFALFFFGRFVVWVLGAGRSHPSDTRDQEHEHRDEDDVEG